MYRSRSLFRAVVDALCMKIELDFFGATCGFVVLGEEASWRSTQLAQYTADPTSCRSGAGRTIDGSAPRKLVLSLFVGVFTEKDGATFLAWQRSVFFAKKRRSER